jgi:hypothetical protein
LGPLHTLFFRVVAGMDERAPEARHTVLAFCILFVPMLALALLAMFSSVNITVQYGPGWFLAFAGWLLALAALAWGMRQRLRRQLFPDSDATLPRVYGTIMGSLLALGVLAMYAVFGGAPILAHHLTAHPGKLTVTVTRKEAQAQRSSCSPRLKIKEFTFFQNDHLCPTARAFRQVGVGTRMHLVGEVSRFGITVDRYTW